MRAHPFPQEWREEARDRDKWERSKKLFIGKVVNAWVGSDHTSEWIKEQLPIQITWERKKTPGTKEQRENNNRERKQYIDMILAEAW